MFFKKNEIPNKMNIEDVKNVTNEFSVDDKINLLTYLYLNNKDKISAKDLLNFYESINEELINRDFLARNDNNTYSKTLKIYDASSYGTSDKNREMLFSINSNNMIIGVNGYGAFIVGAVNEFMQVYLLKSNFHPFEASSQFIGKLNLEQKTISGSWFSRNLNKVIDGITSIDSNDIFDLIQDEQIIGLTSILKESYAKQTDEYKKLVQLINDISSTRGTSENKKNQCLTK